MNTFPLALGCILSRVKRVAARAVPSNWSFDRLRERSVFVCRFPDS